MEISFSSSIDNNNLVSKKNFEAYSPSKDPIDLNSNNNKNDSFSKNLYLQFGNNQNKEKYQINNNIKNNNKENIKYENNIYFELKKENNDIISPKYIYYNKNTNDININKKICNSTLHMLMYLC